MSSQGSERKHRGKVYKGEGGHGRVSGRRKSKKKNKKRETENNNSNNCSLLSTIIVIHIESAHSFHCS